MTERQQIALDPVAAHLNRKAQFFENEALILAGQVRDLLSMVQSETQVVTDDGFGASPDSETFIHDDEGQPEPESEPAEPDHGIDPEFGVPVER